MVFFTFYTFCIVLYSFVLHLGCKGGKIKLEIEKIGGNEMRFKSWVNVVLLCALLVFWFMIFADGLKICFMGLIGALICAVLLNKYSGFWD